jgi:cytoskeletal protein CcmA (bactofilin family)
LSQEKLNNPESEEQDVTMKLFDREQSRNEEVVQANVADELSNEQPRQDAAKREDGAKREDNAKMETGSSASSESELNMETAVRGESLSVVGQTLVIKGEIEAAEDMLIQGRVEGSIKHTADRLIIGRSGVVNADIDARNLIIEGVVEGNIVGSESVVIEETADVRGNIYTARISISDGAQFSGTVDMDLSKSPKH